MVQSSPHNLKVVGLSPAPAASNKYRVNDRKNVWMNFTAIGMTVLESLSHNLNVVSLSSVPAADTMRVKMGKFCWIILVLSWMNRVIKCYVCC
jgi:hypothetical protein